MTDGARCGYFWWHICRRDTRIYQSFSTIIASNAAGINWMDGLYERLLLWLIATALMTFYILRYASKVKKTPAASLVYKIDGIVHPPFEMKYKGTRRTTGARY